LLKNIAEASNGKIVYLIDEPEFTLTPKSTRKVIGITFRGSKRLNKFSSLRIRLICSRGQLAKARNYQFSKEISEDIDIIDARDDGWGIFGRFSPTWGEINWHAYDLPTVEFHNELYGFLQAKATDEDENNYYEENFDTWLKIN